MIHYKNPLLVLGCVPEWEDKILLCRRAIEPRLGFWTVPAGFMENGETMQQAAARECYEEALATVEIGSLLAVVNVTHAGQVHVMFRARLLRAGIRAGPGEPGGRPVRGGEIPWDRTGVSERRIHAAQVLRGPRRAAARTIISRELTRPLKSCKRPARARLWQNSARRDRSHINRHQEG